jgi:hypothetical protein
MASVEGGNAVDHLSEAIYKMTGDKEFARLGWF